MKSIRSSLKVRVLGALALALIAAPGTGWSQTPHGSAEISVARGIDQLNQGKANEAIKHFQKALEITPYEPEALYYAGLAHISVADFKKAEETFLTLLDKGGPSPDVYKELGYLYLRMGQVQKAHEYLHKFDQASDDEEAKEQAALALDRAYRSTKSDQFSVYLSLGAEHDSNVIIEPNNPAMDFGEKEDSRLITYLSASSTKSAKEDVVDVGLDYSFYHSFHDDLDDFDIHNHNVELDLTFIGMDLIEPTVAYEFDYLLFGGEDYSRANKGRVEVEYRKTTAWHADVRYEFQDKAYWDSAIFPSNADLRGYQNSVGLSFTRSQSKYQAELYGYVDQENARENYWSNDGYRIGAKIFYQLAKSLYVQGIAEFNQREYDGDYPGFDQARDDDLASLYVSLIYQLPKDFSVTLSGNFYENQSNLSIFDYDRQIAGIYLSKSLY